MLQHLLGENVQVASFGVNDRTLQSTGNKPYRKEKAFAQSKEFCPDIVIILLGTNDSKDVNWVSPEAFEQQYVELIGEYRTISSKPRIIICTPPCAFKPVNRFFYITNSGKAGTVIPIVGGEVIDLGGRPLKIIELPGHTPGSIAVLDVKNRVLISGDPIQEDGRIFMFGDHRNMNDYVRSLEQLEKRVDEFDEIWPSHAMIPISRDLIRMLHDGAQEILTGKVLGTATEMHGKSIVAFDLKFDVLLCDP